LLLYEKQTFEMQKNRSLPSRLSFATCFELIIYLRARFPQVQLWPFPATRWHSLTHNRHRIRQCQGWPVPTCTLV